LSRMSVIVLMMVTETAPPKATIFPSVSGNSGQSARPALGIHDEGDYPDNGNPGNRCEERMGIVCAEQACSDQVKAFEEPDQEDDRDRDCKEAGDSADDWIQVLRQ